MRKKEVNQLLQEQLKLERIIKSIEKKLNSYPPGTVQVSKHGKGYQYYLRERPEDRIGILCTGITKRKGSAICTEKV